MEYEKRGYLTGNFRLFHINDMCDRAFDYHYHEFDKIVVMLEGDVTYTIEGNTYHLKPGDITLVQHNEIHRPEINPTVPYNRYILYVTPNYISKPADEAASLSSCFQTASSGNAHVLSTDSEQFKKITNLLSELEASLKSEKYASGLYCSALFVQLMILINRITFSEKTRPVKSEPADKRIVEVLKFINENLTEEMTIERISKKFFISRYHLMRIFRDATGETIHSYIRKKRLLKAAELLKQGVPVVKAGEECGFSEYSTFLRAFHAQFGKSPSKMTNDEAAMADIYDY